MSQEENVSTYIDASHSPGRKDLADYIPIEIFRQDLGREVIGQWSRWGRLPDHVHVSPTKRIE